MADQITQLAVQYSWLKVVQPVSGSIVQTPLNADAKRVTLVVSNGGPGTIQLNFGPPSDLTTPLYIHPDKNPLVLKFSDIGPLVQQAVTLISPGTAGTMTLISVFKSS